MRRWLLALLLTVLPLQFSWAAMAAYCPHALPAAPAGALQLDMPPAAAPTPHLDGDAATATDDTGSAGGGLSDQDRLLGCDHCHGHCHGHAPGMLGSQPLALPHAPQAAPQARPAPTSLARALAPPDRPQWPRLA